MDPKTTKTTKAVPLPPNAEVDNSEDIPQPTATPRQRNAAPREYPEDTKVAAPDENELSPRKERSKYEDEMGNPTYFYLNISQGKIVISDLKITLASGAPVDLLDFADEEAILKSKDFRQTVRPHGDAQPLLRRITPEEFDTAYTKYMKLRKAISLQKDEKKKLLDKAEKNPKEIKKLSNLHNDEIEVRPQLVSLVEKLRIGNLQINEKEAEQVVQGKVSGITSEEFIMKIEIMQLTRDEVDYVFQTVGDKQVRAKVQEMYSVEE